MPAARRAPHRLPRTRSRAPRPREPAAPRPAGDSVRARALVAQAGAWVAETVGARWREPAALRAPRWGAESRAGPPSPGAPPGGPPSAADGVGAARPARGAGAAAGGGWGAAAEAWAA